MFDTSPIVQMFPASASALKDVRRFVQGRAERASLPGHVTDDLLIAVTEACSEILAHEVGSTMLVSWWARDGGVEILVKDLGVTARIVPIPDDEEEADEALFEGRLGFPHILEFVDEWEVLPGSVDDPGTVVRLAKVSGEVVEPELAERLRI